MELYRIICMLMIVAHHYVVESGLIDSNSVMMNDNRTCNSMFMIVFGAWGKIAINCFLMITGYYMCAGTITLRKLFKLCGQIYFYRWCIFLVFLIVGHESISVSRFIQLLLPVWGFSNNFVSCFVAFWLLIPFLNNLIKNLPKKQHKLLIVVLLVFYSLLGSIPHFKITFNYITWFCIIYFIASYIRLHPAELFERRLLWGYMTLFTVVLSSISILVMHYMMGNRGFRLSYFFVIDCNKLLPVLVAVCSFLWFKSISIRYSRIINAFGAGTFGVLLIHANSDAIRKWLWKDIIDVSGHYDLPIGNLVFFSITVVFVVFIICNLIDQLRIATVEKWYLNFYDRIMAKKTPFIKGYLE